MLGIRIVCWRDFDDIGRDEIDSFEAADYGSEFASGPAACFGGAGGWGNFWKWGVSIDFRV